MEERPYSEIIDETCPSCRHGIPLSSKVCPDCGYRIRPEEEPAVEEKKKKPERPRVSYASSKAGFGGALILISGILAVLTGIYMVVDTSWVDTMLADLGFSLVEEIIIASGVLTVVFGIVAMVGGYFAVKRKRWGIAIVGGVLGTLAAGAIGLGLIFGLIGLIFVAVSRKEFR